MKATLVAPKPVVPPPSTVVIEMSEREAQLLRLFIGNTDYNLGRITVNKNRGSVIPAIDDEEWQKFVRELYGVLTRDARLTSF